MSLKNGDPEKLCNLFYDQTVHKYKACEPQFFLTTSFHLDCKMAPGTVSRLLSFAVDLSQVHKPYIYIT